MEDVYVKCPVVKTKHFMLRLVEETDASDIFACYNDKQAVKLMNDDNCDFGFFTDSVEKMAETVGYWLDFYQKGYFMRFVVVDNCTKKPELGRAKVSYTVEPLQNAGGNA